MFAALSAFDSVLRSYNAELVLFVSMGVMSLHTSNTTVRFPGRAALPRSQRRATRAAAGNGSNGNGNGAAKRQTSELTQSVVVLITVLRA